MWFKGQELAFAFGVILSFQRMGSVVAGILDPALAESLGVPATLWITFGFTCFSWLCAFGICMCEVYADKQDGKIGATIAAEDKFRCRQLREFGLPYWLIVASCVSTYCSIIPYT